MFGNIFLYGYVLAGLGSTLKDIGDFFGEVAFFLWKLISGGVLGAIVALIVGIASLFLFSLGLLRTKLWLNPDLFLACGIFFLLGGICVGTFCDYQVKYSIDSVDWLAAVVLWGLLSGCVYPLVVFIWNLIDDYLMGKE